ncbi:hypothetical protein AMS68_007360 [Peltaster fructicola]|uniref:Cytoskeletal adapter protein sagA n=1 Tax=Peltaster fructicola TaxID=286661 RepID=A0A6H0Y4B4_9PEZI|nr:hypothetical protein AMS68_007360 [Peltaster fructicola]
MSDSNNDMNPAVLNLSAEEKRVFGFLFDKADVDQLGVITGERAVSFFERTGVQPQVLGEIWQIADTENRGFLSKPGFCIVLRLIGHVQAGREPSSELAFKPAPVPRFEGLQIPAVPAPAQPAVLQPQNSGQGAIRIPPLDPQKVAQYSGLFERSGAQNGLLNGLTAKAIFERAGLPVETLGKIWTLADREQRGALDQTEFIVAMHLLTSTKSKAMTTMPNTLPQGFYDAAARRGAPPPPQARQSGAVARQFTGGSIGAPVRTSSPLARPAGFGTPPPTAPSWLISHAEKAKYDQFFSSIDTQGRGILSGEQAVAFFGDSGLPEDTLASIWDLADIRSEGHLNKDEFAVAMYLIRQQRGPNAAPLPAFLPPALIPPSMRKQNIQQQTQQTTAPAFETVSEPKTMPKSAADDLFGLDEPSQPSQPPLAPLAPQTQKSVDPFETSSPSSPASPVRFQPQPQQANSMFKPFMPTSAFGASLASQTTGGSQGSAPQAKAVQPSAMDDLLGESDANAQESSKLNNDTTELANMSNQIGNLRTQMEDTQAKKSTTQAELNTTSTQKRDLETRLQQFRAQYEQEVRVVKELEQQLTQSRESTKKLGQELALLEGASKDLQAQHQSISQGLQADQAENASLKQQITQLNAEVARLKPEIEKMKLDARQQKADPAARDIVSPAGSTMSSTNPFFRKAGVETERSASPAATGTNAATPSAFDQLFGPAFAQETRGPPPATTFANKSHPSGLTDSISSDGKLTPAATPPPAESRELPVVSEPPPPSLSRQFTPEQLPVGGLKPASQDHDETASTAVLAGSEIGSEGAMTPAAIVDNLPGAFPGEPETVKKAVPSSTEADFNSAFASFGAGEKSRDAEHNEDPFTSSFPQPPKAALSNSEFPPIRSLEHEDEDDDSDSDDEPAHSFNNNFSPATTAPATSTDAPEAAVSELPKITAQSSPPTYEQSEGPARTGSEPNAFPKEFTGLLPARSDPTSPEPVHEEPTTPKAVQQKQPSFPVQTPISATGTATSDVFHDASSRPLSLATDAAENHHGHAVAAPKNAFDEFDDFDDLAEAQEADKNGSDFDFGFGHSRGPSEFDAAFDSPAQTTNTTRTNTAASSGFGSQSTNGFPSVAATSPFAGGNTANSSIQHTPETKHDWDAIFSGLDNSNTGNLENSLGSDPWETGTSSGLSANPVPTTQAGKAKDIGRAITPGTEHDDPILKRLTGMGYARGDALKALEKYDYDINAVSS